jgi:hypothetical protein
VPRIKAIRRFPYRHAFVIWTIRVPEFHEFHSMLARECQDRPDNHEAYYLEYDETVETRSGDRNFQFHRGVFYGFSDGVMYTGTLIMRREYWDRLDEEWAQENPNLVIS